jgi:hypothetical protein
LGDLSAAPGADAARTLRAASARPHADEILRGVRAHPFGAIRIGFGGADVRALAPIRRRTREWSNVIRIG